MPGIQYRTLLEQSLAHAMIELRATKNWQTVRISTVNQIAEQLALIGRQRLREQRMREELMGDKFNKRESLLAKAGDWINFLMTIQSDHKQQAKALMWSAFVDFLTGELNTVAHSSPDKPTPAPTSSTGTFADLFNDPADLLLFTTALQKVRFEKPVINHKGEWTGGRRDGSKSILVAGIDRLESGRKIRKIENRKLLVKLLNAHFPGLNMGADARLFGEVVDQQIKVMFIALIPE